MGSAFGTNALPDASSPSLILTHPTDVEKSHTWTLNHVEWGGALSLEDYLAREPYLTTIPLSCNGGMTHWILTDATAPKETRPVLSSCETLRKRVFVADGTTGQVKEEIVYGIASVFTAPAHRGRKYGPRMMGELGKALRDGVKGDRKPIASALWSDIGKVFYSKKGWKPFPSSHVDFVVKESTSSSNALPEGLQHITYGNLESFCALDEQLLRQRMQRLAAKNSTTKFAIVPDHDAMLWHLYRDDFIAKIVFKDRQPSEVKGAVAGIRGKRIWAIWSRQYYGDGKAVEKNNLYILRLVVEDANAPQDELASAFGKVMRAAATEARSWSLGRMEMWNPDPTVKQLIESSGMEVEWVEREKDSIPSLMWYGEGDIDNVEWVANEKYCWC